MHSSSILLSEAFVEGTGFLSLRKDGNRRHWMIAVHQESVGVTHRRLPFAGRSSGADPNETSGAVVQDEDVGRVEEGF